MEMAGDPKSIAERLLNLELRLQPKDSATEVGEKKSAEPVTRETPGPETAEAAQQPDEAESAVKDQQASAAADEEIESEGDELSADSDEELDDVKEEVGDEGKEPDDLDELIDQVTSDNLRSRFIGAQSIRRRVSNRYEAPAYSRLLTSPALAALVENLDKDLDQELQFESAWALTNLLSGSGARPADLVASCGLARPLIRLLQSPPSDRMREQACWALANVVGESPAWRNQLLAGGDLLGALLALWDSDPNDGMLDASSLLLVNLFRDRDPRIKFELAQRLIPRAVALLRHPYESAVPNVVWALSYAIEGCEPRARLLLQVPDALPCLAEFLDSWNDALLVPTMRLFCVLSASMDALPACLVNAKGVFESMRRLMNHRDAKIRRQTVLFFGNLSIGPDAQLEAAAQVGCLTGIGRVLLGVSGDGNISSDLERREAFWILPNFMLARGHTFSRRIIDECLEGFLESLSLQDAEIHRCVLLCVRHLLSAARYKNRNDLDFEALKRKIEACGGLKKIEMFQKTDNKFLVKLSYQIIDHFFLGNEKKYLEKESSREASPSTAESKIGDEHPDGGGESPLKPVSDKDALSSLIGGLQAAD